jgi:hypothetical protein
MILYSITINIEKGVHDQWLEWMRNSYVPEIMKTGFFIENKILKLLTEEDANTGITYSFQYYLKDLDTLEQFQIEAEPVFTAALYKKYRNQFVEFTTILEVI